MKLRGQTTEYIYGTIDLLMLDLKPGNKNYTERRERDECITELLRRGIPAIEISKKIGKSKSYVSKMLFISKNKNKPKIAKTKALTKPSIAAGGRTIGTSLSTILANMKNNDILQQVIMVDTLEEAGYKREAVIEKIDGPSMKDLTKIMDAVKLLSKQYTITKKEIK